jgi:hypothetical protein
MFSQSDGKAQMGARGWKGFRGMVAAGGAVFFLPLSQKNRRDAVYSFLSAERRTIFAISVNIAEKNGEVVAYESWTNDARSNVELAEGVADWIELRAESAANLEATITVSEKPAQ